MKRSDLLKLSDAQVVGLLLENDESAVRFVFYDKYNALLRLNFAKTAGNKSVDYEDLVQELYIFLSKNDWEKLRKYDVKLPFINWFSVVSYRFFKDYTHAMIDSAQQLPISDMDDHTLAVAGVNKLNTIMLDIKAAIAKLWPPRDREIVEALILNEEEPAEVAQRFNVTVDNLYNIKRRALAKLIQKHLQEYKN
ncbi:MAG: sigma-70 family RNA polymerase sigma factor [Bacteroidales bacterium]|nr:sigma-70 family RNA polymerase sigma factor [Bacteroidales bacterium]